MIKDLENRSLETPAGIDTPSEESLEEILASIRKIMDPAAPAAEPYNLKKDHRTASAAKEESPSIPLVLTKKSAPQDVLVLKKKSDPLEIVQQKTNPAEKRAHMPSANAEKSSEKKGGLESLVKSSVSSLVQAWLEKNLPEIVEKVVKEEIQKLLDPRHKNQ